MWIMAWRRANTDPEESRRGTVTVTKVAKTVVGTRLWQWKQQGRESRVPWRSGLNDMWTVEQNRRKNEKIQVWRLWNNEPSAWLPFPEQPFSRDQLCIAFCYRSVPKSCPTLCNLMDCNMPGFPVPHYLTEFSQTHVHWVSDAIHLSLSLPPPYTFAFNIPHHQGLSQWVSSLHQVIKVLELQLQHQCFQRIFRVDFL